jgi:hypothetical protein
MKKIALSLVASAFALVVLAQQPLVSNAKPNVGIADEFGLFNWSQTTYDFGKIKINNPATHEFSFINGGDVPLVITSVQASCGCTVAKYTKEPVSPGSSGFVTATYNAAKAGVFTKTITVNANTEAGTMQLTIKGEVVE